jgi:Luciferase
VQTSNEEKTTTRPHAPDARDAVIREVSSWQGVSVHNHRFGGVEFRLGRRELGHLHTRFADLPFPRRVRDELVAAGRAKPHHILPSSGWVTVPMRTPSEGATVIDLFRLNYDRAVPPPPEAV